jgi:hypothetical protein
MEQGNGDGAVRQRSTHATRQIWTRDPKSLAWPRTTRLSGQLPLTLLPDSIELTLPGRFEPATQRVWPDHGPLGFQGSYPSKISACTATALQLGDQGTGFGGGVLRYRY